MEQPPFQYSWQKTVCTRGPATTERRGIISYDLNGYVRRGEALSVAGYLVMDSDRSVSHINGRDVSTSSTKRDSSGSFFVAADGGVPKLEVRFSKEYLGICEDEENDISTSYGYCERSAWYSEDETIRATELHKYNLNLKSRPFRRYNVEMPTIVMYAL